MNDETIVETALAAVSDTDPPCDVPEGIWAFTDEELRTLIMIVIELVRGE